MILTCEPPELMAVQNYEYPLQSKAQLCTKVKSTPLFCSPGLKKKEKKRNINLILAQQHSLISNFTHPVGNYTFACDILKEIREDGW